MTQLIAQAESFWPSLIHAAANNGFWIFLGVCVLAGTAKHLVQLVLKHNERLAMIKAGMQPEQDKPVYPRGYADPDKRVG